MKSKATGKIDVQASSQPLQAAAFSSLEAVDTTRLSPGVESRPLSQAPPLALGKQRLILRREKKDRGGKTVVVISGFDTHPAAIEELARLLRKKLGCGGTAEGKEIVLQGDQPELVAQNLRQLGHHVRGVA